MKVRTPRACPYRHVLLFLLAACDSAGPDPTGTETTNRFRFLSDTVALEAGDTLSLALEAVAGSVALDRRSVAWRTEDATIASVSGEGLVAGGRSGTTRITATAGSVADTVAVVVSIPRASSVRAALLTGGDQLIYRVNSVLPEPIAARLVHARSGRPVVMAGVEWSTITGAVAATVATSNDSGVVSARWTLARTAGSHTLALRLSGDTATLLQVRASLGIRTLKVSGVSELAWPGDTLRPAYAAFDAAGDSLDPGAIALRLPPTGPLRAIGGRLVAVSEGRTVVGIEGAGYRDSLAIIIGTLLRGQGTALLADQRVEGAWFYLRSGACVDSAQLDTDGRFVLRATRPLHGQVSDQYFDAPTAETRRVLPSARFGARVDSGAFVRALLFPWDVVIPSGRWSGQRRPVSLFAAMSGGEGSRRFYRQVNLDWMYGWPSPGPIPVFFDRESDGVQPVSAADSVATWQVLRGLEQSIGLTLFQPSESRLHPPTWFRVSGGDSVLARRGGIAVQFRRESTGGASGRCNGTLIAVTGCPRVINYEFGTMVLNTPSNASLSALYALGFDHTCMFPSALSGFVYDARTYSLCNQFRMATADEYAETTPIETAHMHLYFALTRLQRQWPDAWSVRETLNGQRVLQHGLPTLEALFGSAARPTSIEDRATVSGGASCR